MLHLQESHAPEAPAVTRGEAIRITVPFIVEIQTEVEVLVYLNPEDSGTDHEEDSFELAAPYKNLSRQVREALACDRDQRKEMEALIAAAAKRARTEHEDFIATM